MWKNKKKRFLLFFYPFFPLKIFKMLVKIDNYTSIPQENN